MSRSTKSTRFGPGDGKKTITVGVAVAVVAAVIAVVVISVALIPPAPQPQNPPEVPTSDSAFVTLDEEYLFNATFRPYGIQYNTSSIYRVWIAGGTSIGFYTVISSESTLLQKLNLTSSEAYFANGTSKILEANITNQYFAGYYCIFKVLASNDWHMRAAPIPDNMIALTRDAVFALER